MPVAPWPVGSHAVGAMEDPTYRATLVLVFVVPALVFVGMTVWVARAMALH